jgi:hypothetical protein
MIKIRQERLEQQNESTGIGKAHVPQLQNCEAQTRGARHLQGPAA